MTAQRIASLLASSTEILYGLGLGDRVEAVSHECDYPEEVRHKPRVTFTTVDATRPSGEIDAAVRAQTAAGKALYRIDIDRLAELRPDLIVTQAQCDVCAVSLDDVRVAVATRDELQSAEIVALNPVALDDVFNDIVRVGQAAGCKARAKNFVASLLARLERIQRETASLDENQRPRTVCLEWIDPLMVAANWTPELVQIAGGQCALAEPGARTTSTNWKDIVAYNPNVIVVAPCGFDLERSLEEARTLRDYEGWNNLDAVKAGRIYAADGNAYFNRSGPRLIDTLEILAALIHPDRFPTLAQHPHPAWRSLTAS